MQPFSYQVLDAAHEMGSRFWDTSDYYGDSEELIGKWYVWLLITRLFFRKRCSGRFKKTGKRDDIFLATKFGFTMDASMNVKIIGTAEYAKECLDKSLKRLGVDQIDLWYLHRQVVLTSLSMSG